MEIHNEMFFLCADFLWCCILMFPLLRRGKHFKCNSCTASASSGSVVLCCTIKLLCLLKELCFAFPTVVNEIFSLSWSPWTAGLPPALSAWFPLFWFFQDAQKVVFVEYLWLAMSYNHFHSNRPWSNEITVHLERTVSQQRAGDWPWEGGRPSESAVPPGQENK